VAATRALSIYRGDDYTHRMTFVHSAESAAEVEGVEAGDPVDLSDRTWAAQWRRHADSDDAVAFVIDASAGVLLASLTGAVTADLPTKGVWDLQGTYIADGLVETLLAGPVTCTKDVTRS
jgi:hypothetical protein